jgi:carboxymethylenebutenolidase
VGISPIFAPSHPEYLGVDAPLKQIAAGIEASKVTCKEGLELVLKQSNGKPACLKPTSVGILIERGWAIHVLPEYHPENNNSEIFKIGNFQVETKLVIYDNTEGFLAMPVDEGQYPGVVMIHEWWGLNDNIKEMAEKLASHGYIVLAVDLYDGQVATTSDEARKLISSFDQNLGIQNMNFAASYLQENYNVESLGSIGWCFGGGQSLNLALNNEGMDATIIYYGQLQTDPQILSTISWPVLGIFAELDQGITVETVNNFEKSLNELSIPNQIHVYSGVDHAFANPSGDRYAPEESKDAWQKTLDFLNKNLKK